VYLVKIKRNKKVLLNGLNNFLVRTIVFINVFNLFFFNLLKLEDLVENSWRKIKRGIVTLTALSVLGFFVGCGSGNSNLTGTEDPIVPQNQAPTTQIVSGPSGLINDDEATFVWDGSDVDGNVVGYNYKLHPKESNYSYTTASSKTFYSLEEGQYTFYVKAKDNDGTFDSSPAIRSFDVAFESSGGNSGVTNSEGIVTFIDSSTGELVDIYVRDKNTNAPLQGVETFFIDGNGYEVFSTVAFDDYLPGFAIFPHNSIHYVQVGKYGDPYIEIVDDGETMSAIYEWLDEDPNGSFTDVSYKGTWSKDEYVDFTSKAVALCKFYFSSIGGFISSASPISLSDVFGKLSESNILFDYENLPPMWDVYEYSGDNFNPSAANLTFVPSNIPSVSIDNFVTDENSIIFDWSAIDGDVYPFYPLYAFSLQDITVLLGPTVGHDLYTEYKISNLNTGDPFIDWKYLNQSPKTIFNIPSGDYCLELRVTDEIENTSTSFPQNFTSFTSSFDTLTTILQPGSEGKDARVTISRYANGDSSLYDFNGGSESMSNVDHFYISSSTADILNRSYLEFNLNSIPSNAEVIDSKLFLYGAPWDTYYENPDIDVRRVLEGWGENNITWANQPSFSSSFVTRNYNIDEYFDWDEFNLTSLVQGWINGSFSNHGVLLKLVNENGEYQTYHFSTSDYSTLESRPKLEITYVLN